MLSRLKEFPFTHILNIQISKLQNYRIIQKKSRKKKRGSSKHNETLLNCARILLRKLIFLHEEKRYLHKQFGKRISQLKIHFLKLPSIELKLTCIQILLRIPVYEFIYIVYTLHNMLKFCPPEKREPLLKTYFQ